MAQTPNMVTGGKTPLAEFHVNGTFYVAIYQGSLSPFDVLIKYRQFEGNKWSRIRTPKHIHWAVDILIKQHMENNATERLIESLIDCGIIRFNQLEAKKKEHIFSTQHLY